MVIEIWIDGACEPVNPGGTATYGLVVKDDRQVVHQGSGRVGSGEGMSNNVAEYAGLIAALRYLRSREFHRAIIFSDSQLVVRQSRGEWAANSGGLLAMV